MLVKKTREKRGDTVADSNKNHLYKHQSNLNLRKHHPGQAQNPV